MKQQTRLRRDRWRRTGEWNSEGRLGLHRTKRLENAVQALDATQPHGRARSQRGGHRALAWGTNVHYACPCRAGCLRTAPTCYAWKPKKGVDQESRKIAVMSHLKLPICPTSSLGQLDKIGPVVQYTFQLYRQTGNGRAAW